MSTRSSEPAISADLRTPLGTFVRFSKNRTVCPSGAGIKIAFRTGETVARTRRVATAIVFALHLAPRMDANQNARDVLFTFTNSVGAPDRQPGQLRCASHAVTRHHRPLRSRSTSHSNVLITLSQDSRVPVTEEPDYSRKQLRRPSTRDGRSFYSKDCTPSCDEA